MSYVRESYTPERKPPSWVEWVERNAKPRTYIYRCARQIPTQWQKRGPMSRRDWVRFYHWAAKRAIPRPPYEPKPEPEPRCDKRKGPCRKTVDSKPLEEIMKNIKKLIAPKYIREKYEFPEEPDYPYAPKIHWKQAPKKDKGRPFQPVQVPKVFHHWELEAEFWNTVRFPVSANAMRYTPTENMKKLATPKEKPFPIERLHCPYPDVMVEEEPKRKKMSYTQWRNHLKRLEFLARPVVRPDCNALLGGC